MAKQYAEAVTNFDEPMPKGMQIGTIRIAEIRYQHLPIKIGPNGLGATLGEMVDQSICNSLGTGASISEVSIFFETPEQQAEMARIYYDRGMVKIKT